MKFLSSSVFKKCLLVVFLLLGIHFLLNGWFGLWDSAFAQAVGWAWAWGWLPNQTSSVNPTGTREMLNMLLKIVYIFLRPLLVIAWLALDNTLVYASVFNMDAPLRKFWNIMKNFANFALWFMVIFAIIKSIFTNSWAWSFKDEKSPLGVIKSTLIAGVLIQASRFLMAALIDISTIMTYAVGAIPLNVIKNEAIGQRKIITVNSSLDLDRFDIAHAGWEWFKVRYTTQYGNQKLEVSPCRVEKNYVVGRESGLTGYRNVEKINAQNDSRFAGNEVCVLFGTYFVLRNEDAFMSKIAEIELINYSFSGDASNYKNYMDFLLGMTWGAGVPARHENPDLTQYIVNLTTGNANYITTGKLFDSVISGTMLADVINSSQWFVWPLVTIYSSLLNFAQLTDSETASIGRTSWVFLIKTGVSIALFFPLLALAIVLIMRIGVLWLFIVWSPFIVLKLVFSNFLKMEKYDKYISLEGILWIVFAPVVTVAALSLSLVFLTVLVDKFNLSDNSTSSTIVQQGLSIQKISTTTDKDKMIVWGIAEFEFDKLSRGESMDRFSRLMINFFAIALLWMIVFAAIKASALGEKIGGTIESFGKNVLGTMPIVSIPWSDEKVGVGTMLRTLGNIPKRKAEALVAADNEVVTNYLNNKKLILNDNELNTILDKYKNEPKEVDTYITKLKPNATLPQVFAANQQAFLTKLNTSNDTAAIYNKLPSAIQQAYDAQLEAPILWTIRNVAPQGDANAINTAISNNKELQKDLATYFDKTGKNTYVVNQDNKKLTITKNSDNNYTTTIEDIPQTQTPTVK